MMRFTAFLVFPAMFGLAMISHEFIILLISDKWIESIPLLRILCISGAFLSFFIQCIKTSSLAVVSLLFTCGVRSY